MLRRVPLPERALLAVRGVGSVTRVGGVDREVRVALDLARRRLPTATLIHDDLLSWTPPDTLQRSVGLVIAGGDLLPLITTEADLLALFTTAARHVSSNGIVGIDATLMDPERLAAATENLAWESDIEWADEDGLVVRVGVHRHEDQSPAAVHPQILRAQGRVGRLP